jgi:hypothetical protein
MKRDDVVKALTKVLKPGDGANWQASRAAKSLPRGLDPAFLRRVFDKLLSEEFTVHTFGTTLPDEYVPLALEVLARKKTCDAVFLSNLPLAQRPKGFRDAVKALIKLGTDASAKRTTYLKEITAVPEYVSAAQATVAVKGMEAWLQLRVLAFDGSADSADILLPLVVKALKEKGEDLDFLVDLLDDRARAKSSMQPMFAALDEAQGARAKVAKVAQLAERFGGDGPSFNLRLGFESNQTVDYLAKLSVSFWFFARKKPEAAVFAERQPDLRFSWEDGKTKENTAGFPKLRTLDELPAWMKAVAAKYRCTWNRTPLYLTTSLRGKARAGLLEWLLGSRT